MALDADEEILQDFLVEAGEILEKLSEQLVDLEQHPDDSDLLNAIFRGFHTVKGGAGFLQLEALVNCCHSAENVFDILRNHKRKVTPDLMDVVLEALDNVNAMFEEVRNREEPTPAPDELIEALDALAKPESEDAPAVEAPTPAQEPSSADVGQQGDQGDITDEEFEQLLDALADEKSDGQKPVGNEQVSTPAESAGGSDSDEITDDEFEALLDQLHGKGQFAGAPAEDEAPKADIDTSGGSEKSSGDADLISDDEFENLLDELHGKGAGPSAGAAAGEPKPAPAPSSKAEPAPEPKKAVVWEVFWFKPKRG